MKKISQLGLTGRQLFLKGIIYLALGASLMLTGSFLPVVGFKFILLIWQLLAIFDFVSAIFGKKRSSDNFLVLLFKILILGYLLTSNFTTNVPIFLTAILVGVYLIFASFINLVTYYLYLKDNIRPRSRYLIDGVWLVLLGIASFLSTTGDSEMQFLVVGIYLFMYGLTNIRDGIFFESEIGKNNLKRRTRIPLPLVIAALIPRRTLQKINDYLLENSEENIEKHYNVQKISAIPDLEIFIHVTKDGFGAIGHVDLCYEDIVISYGNYDETSQRFFNMMGDGVLLKAGRESYIEFCKEESHKTLLGYGIILTKEQRFAVEERLSQLDKLTVPWIPSNEPVSKDTDGKKDVMYAYKMTERLGARFFKFKESKFKTYFVLSTNCVLLADSIIGKAGTDILSAKGFISPGTYQNYLDREFEKLHSIVISKSIYQ